MGERGRLASVNIEKVACESETSGGVCEESGEERRESADERDWDDMDNASMPVATPDRERELQEGLDQPNASSVPFSPMSDVPPSGGQHDEQHAVPR
eukprot:1967789-Pleurochrysis_carterae.AAC.1